MIILYHANCNDGSASALAAWLKLGDDGHQYIGVSHGRPAPDVKGQDVLMLDFCYPRDTLIKLQAKSIFILDHHLSAQKDLSAPFPDSCNISYEFDLKRSGAMMSWQHFFPNEPIPRFYTLIQDRDIWLNNEPEAPMLSYGLSIFAKNFRAWKVFIEDQQVLNKTIEAGRAIQDFINAQIDIIIPTYRMQQIAGINVPVVNAPSFMVSDLVHQLLIEHPNAPFAAAYSDLPDIGMRNYSLRSEDHRQDVSVIAKQFGGGGHRNAAAFNIPIPAQCLAPLEP